MRLENLDIIARTANYPSLSAAAEALYIPQTTLTSLIKSVEGELGFSIFSRSSNGVALTPQGKALMPLAQEVTNLYSQMLAIAATYENQKSITIFAHPRVYNYFGVYIIRAFQNLMPSTSLSILEAPDDKVARRLLTDDVKIAIVTPNCEDAEKYIDSMELKGLSCQLLLTANRYLYASKRSKFAGRTSISYAELADEHLGLTEYGMDIYYREGMNKIIPRHSIYSNMYLLLQSAANSDIVFFYVGTGLPLEDGPELILDSQFDRLTVVDDSALDRIFLLYNPGKKITPVEKALLECIRDVFASMKPTECL